MVPTKEALDRDFGDLRSLQSLIIQHAEQGLEQTSGGAKNFGAALNSTTKAIEKPLITRCEPSIARSTPSVAKSAPFAASSVLLDGKHAVTPDCNPRLRGRINNSPSAGYKIGRASCRERVF